MVLGYFSFQWFYMDAFLTNHSNIKVYVFELKGNTLHKVIKFSFILRVSRVLSTDFIT